MRVVAFTYGGKFGHFLRAEASAAGLTYPVPPRTALLGLLGAVLGLPKNAAPVALASIRVAVGGKSPQRFWHKTNIRKDPPSPLARVIRAGQGDRDTAPEKNYRQPQEWLYRPEFCVWAALDGQVHGELAERLQSRRWHYTPCLGLSEMLADLQPLGEYEAQSLAIGIHDVDSVTPQEAGQIDFAAAQAHELALQSLRMPASVDAFRVFTHRAYWLERDGRPFSVITADAWAVGPHKVVFL